MSGNEIIRLFHDPKNIALPFGFLPWQQNVLWHRVKRWRVGQSKGRKTYFNGSNVCTLLGNGWVIPCSPKSCSHKNLHLVTVALRNTSITYLKEILWMILYWQVGAVLDEEGNREWLLLTWSQESVKRHCSASICTEMLTQIKQE